MSFGAYVACPCGPLRHAVEDMTSHLEQTRAFLRLPLFGDESDAGTVTGRLKPSSSMIPGTTETTVETPNMEDGE